MTLPSLSSHTHLNDPNTIHSSMPLPVSHFLAVLHPRKSRYRSAFIALAAFLCISTYILLVQHPSFSPTHALRHTDTPAADQIAVALESVRNSRVPGAGGTTNRKHKKLIKGQQATLSPAQELAAVSSFLASLPQNIIPLSINPHVPIDPQLVLDFDTRSARAAEELKHMVHDVWSRNPVFLYSKLYSPSSREIKAMLAKMHLRPAPTIIDVDIRDDAEVLEPIIARLTSSHDLPVLLIGGKSVGSMEDIRALETSGELRSLVTKSGAVIDGAKRKKHRK
ncbi:putative monothiol glutaredoxin F10D7.3 [Hypsizygus marmoreus]|uniref:Monothiol glutaredoxin F10D7.3 n=1 Tax=Hypsizygus marmoreus TaxID=39966 RepID=A0A369JV49_HYPMA|nr:putative monothiol glutaredoxin F10D7.3 [Hypsizygus marmoreus]